MSEDFLCRSGVLLDEPGIQESSNCVLPVLEHLKPLANYDLMSQRHQDCGISTTISHRFGVPVASRVLIVA